MMLVQLRAPVCGQGPIRRCQTHIRRVQRSKLLVRAASTPSEPEVPDLSYNFVAQSQGLFRSLPLWAGGVGILGVLANRSISGIAPVVDASSSQSRSDVLIIAMSAVLLLTGLQWLSLKPRKIPAVPLDGQEVYYVDSDTKLPPAVKDEVQWAWNSLKANTRCKSLVLFYQGRNIFHAGFINQGRAPGTAKGGDVCKKALESGQGNYLANLMLYPGRLEFTQFLPDNTQGVVVQPLGNSGLLVAGTDTVRGFGRLDQAWIATIADKLEVSMEGLAVPKAGGQGFAAKGKTGPSSSQKS